MSVHRRSDVTQTSQQWEAYFIHPGRLITFSDGVIAIAITLMVLNLRVPTVSDTITPLQFWSALRSHWPDYFAFLLSFGTLYVAWVSHHLMFQRLEYVSWSLVFANGLFLLSVTLLPFPTLLVATQLIHAGAAVAVAIYAASNIWVDVTFWLVVRAVQATHPGGGETLRRLRHGAELGFLAFVVSLGVAFVSPILALLIIALVWSYWALRPGAASTPWSPR